MELKYQCLTKMTDLKLDLHGSRHHEVPLKVENFLFLNQENMPILIICGNSQKMINIVKDVLEDIDCIFEIGSGINYGCIIVRKI